MADTLTTASENGGRPPASNRRAPEDPGKDPTPVNLHETPDPTGPRTLTPGLSSVLEVAATFDWDTKITPARTVEHCSLLELDHGPHTVLAWWFDNGILDVATLYREGHPDPDGLGQVATTHDRGDLVGWVAAHGTKAAAA